MKIRSIEIEIDVEDYLERLGLHKVKPVGNNIMACCPFHRDSSPSFGVNTDDGQYNCFGCGAKGSFAHLIKEMERFDTVWDAEEYLIGMYGRYAANPDEAFELDFGEVDNSDHADYFIDESVLEQYMFRSPYLGNRGITEKWQRFMEVGYCKRSGAVTFPWRDHLGRLLTVKKRTVKGKQFWYEPSMPKHIKAETLWGLNQVLKYGFRKVAVTEAEIDGLSVWQSNDLLKSVGEDPIGVIAIGGNQFTNLQASKLIRLLPADTEIISFTDNDEGGTYANSLIMDKLCGHFHTITSVDWILAPNAKDSNDVPTEMVVKLLQNRIPLGLNLTIY